MPRVRVPGSLARENEILLIGLFQPYTPIAMIFSRNCPPKRPGRYLSHSLSQPLFMLSHHFPLHCSFKPYPVLEPTTSPTSFMRSPLMPLSHTPFSLSILFSVMTETSFQLALDPLYSYTKQSNSVNNHGELP